MPRYLAEPVHRHGSPRRIGLLLVNLGTPDAPDRRSLRRYLAQFLWDDRVVEVPRPLWWLILHGIILNTRPAKSAAKYARIWMPEGGSPLRHWTNRQAAALAAALAADGGEPVEVAVGMRYGQPSIASAVLDLRARGCDRLLLLPLYPQYAASTSATAFDALAATLGRLRNLPAVRTLRGYHDHPAYIGALAGSVRAHWSVHGQPDRLVMSFHGVPRFTLERGDPYHCECHKTARLLAEALQLPPDAWVVSFQSLFGRAEWIRPYTEATVRELARAGLRRIDVVCPGFPADCLETLEEIGMEVRDAFLAEGGREYHYIPALNDQPRWTEALAAIAREQLAGWRHDGWNAADEERAGAAIAEAARRLGATG